ncbi:hypothetical protein QQS21_003300 [Conoideocrella luteorostrata]|uniref:Myb transcription factor n=1 Tax=Conoideocrella luteorostrata TaxID=1105319 RepID=A0AAJ0CXK6_9HYPO|nr:hypothetical protein QQS21_003300 [Conoideocrella luteorostrata]
MANVDDRSVAGSVASAGDANVDELPGVDVDFGAIEMFDSNAAPDTFSSQAPEAIMTDDAALHSSTKKSKRQKKDKRHKKRRSSQQEAISSPLVPEEKESHKKHKKSRRKSAEDVEVPSSFPYPNEQSEPSADIPWGQLQEEAAVSSSQTKKKRKLSDSAEGKRRKKHRPQDQESEDQDGGRRRSSQDAGSSAFLRKKKDRRGISDSAIFEGDEPQSDPQRSPTVAHLRRRSQSRDTGSRENSVPVPDQMDVDMRDNGHALGATAVTSGEAGLGLAVDTEHDVARLAREAWDEHRNGQHDVDGRQNGDQDKEMADQYPQEPLNAGIETAGEVETSSPQQKKTRSTRKKAKPTFFEQPIPDIAEYDGDLPSPSAMTPKPRKRSKPAAKKESRGRKPKREKLSQSMRGGSVEADEYAEGRTAERRNRLSGYTQGRFTDAELARISGAVESFRASHGLSQQEVNELIHAPGGTTAGDTNAQLWVLIFDECPDRHRQKVINITRKKFHNFVARGTWTTEQDAELTELINIHGTKWSKIAGLINRHPEDLRDRYRNYIVCGANQRKDAWDEQEEARLTQHIMESMQAIDELRIQKPEKDLLKRSYEELIDWQGISECMDRTRSRLQCITKWKSMNIRTHGSDKLASTQPDSQISFRLEKGRRQIAAMPSEERYRLVMAIQATAVGADVKIPWQRLVDKPFRNQWHRFTQMLLWRRLKATVPNHMEATVRDAAEYLVERYNQTGDLPDIPDDLFDDADEMNFIQTMSNMASSGNLNRGQGSEEFVGGSDVEDNDAETNGNTLEQAVESEQNQPQDEEMNIDPALVEAAQPTKKATPAKRAGKNSSSRTRGRKSAVADVDPIEDNTQEPQHTQEQESEIDVEQLRRTKTPSKFQSRSSKKGDQQSSPRDEDSVMDDMEDLPAKVAAQ